MDYQHMIFSKALNIEQPFYMKNIEFLEEEGELHMYVDFHKGSKFKCPLCSKDGLSIHDTTEKTWRHLNFFQYKAFIHLRTPRTDCPDHGVHFIDVPWGGVNSGFTLLIEAFIMQLVKHMPVQAIAKLIKETDKKIWRVIKKHVNNARLDEDYSNVTKVGVDETSSKKGHNYVTLFVDMDKAKVIHVTEGKDSETVRSFKEDLIRHNGKPNNIVNFSSDMSPAFISGINNNFNAAITFDKFHVMKLVNTALDETRRGEQKTNIDLKHSRYSWLKNPRNLNKKQSTILENLSKSNLKTARAYRLKLAIQDIYASSIDKSDAAINLQKWYSWAVRSKIEPMKTLAKSIKKHWIGILNYFDSKLTNGLLEGINSIVQTLKSRARGYKNIDNFIAMIYLLTGKLNLRLGNP